jgi:restriction system protein
MKKQDAKHDVVPKYDELINPTLKALQSLGGSGKNDEIYDEVVKLLKLPDKVLDVPHGKGGSNELDYRLRWARTYLKNYGAINNSDRAIWSLNSDYLSVEKLDINEVKQAIRNKFSEKEKNQTQISELNFEVDTQDIPIMCQNGW